MKLLINTLLSSVKSLGEVFGFAFFFFVVFSILGISLWAGLDYNRCYQTEHPVNNTWTLIDDETFNCGSRKCDQGFCGSILKEKVNLHLEHLPNYEENL